MPPTIQRQGGFDPSTFAVGTIAPQTQRSVAQGKQQAHQSQMQAAALSTERALANQRAQLQAQQMEMQDRQFAETMRGQAADRALQERLTKYTQSQLNQREAQRRKWEQERYYDSAERYEELRKEDLEYRNRWFQDVRSLEGVKLETQQKILDRMLQQEQNHQQRLQKATEQINQFQKRTRQQREAIETIREHYKRQMKVEKYEDYLRMPISTERSGHALDSALRDSEFVKKLDIPPRYIFQNPDAVKSAIQDGTLTVSDLTDMMIRLRVGQDVFADIAEEESAKKDADTPRKLFYQNLSRGMTRTLHMLEGLESSDDPDIRDAVNAAIGNSTLGEENITGAGIYEELLRNSDGDHKKFMESIQEIRAPLNQLIMDIGSEAEREAVKQTIDPKQAPPKQAPDPAPLLPSPSQYQTPPREGMLGDMNFPKLDKFRR